MLFLLTEKFKLFLVPETPISGPGLAPGGQDLPLARSF